MTSGIYMIRNKINEKIYIGQSINVENRLNNHLKELRSEKHVNIFLQKDFKEYKEENFTFEKIYDCDEEFLNPMEKYFIEKYNTTHNGYNIMNGNSMLNKKIKNKIRIEKLKKDEEEKAKKIRQEFNDLKCIDLYVDESLYFDSKLYMEMQCVIDKYLTDDSEKEININKLSQETKGFLSNLEVSIYDDLFWNIEKQILEKAIESLKKYTDLIKNVIVQDVEVKYNHIKSKPVYNLFFQSKSMHEDIEINIMLKKSTS